VRIESYRLAKSAADREDLSQEALVALWPLPLDTPLGYVRSKARWAMLDWCRLTLPLSRGHYKELGGEAANELTSSRELPDAELLGGVEPSAEAWAVLSESLDALTFHEWLVLVLLMGATQEEVAGRLGVTASAVAHSVRSIRRKVGT
jgi:DNA-directed RNA polymerase specialized sigma24 family protein